jgi:hypothetical protein
MPKPAPPPTILGVPPLHPKEEVEKKWWSGTTDKKFPYLEGYVSFTYVPNGAAGTMLTVNSIAVDDETGGPLFTIMAEPPHFWNVASVTCTGSTPLEAFEKLNKKIQSMSDPKGKKRKLEPTIGDAQRHWKFESEELKRKHAKCFRPADGLTAEVEKLFRRKARRATDSMVNASAFFGDDDSDIDMHAKSRLLSLELNLTKRDLVGFVQEVLREEQSVRSRRNYQTQKKKGKKTRSVWVEDNISQQEEDELVNLKKKLEEAGLDVEDFLKKKNISLAELRRNLIDAGIQDYMNWSNSQYQRFRNAFPQVVGPLFSAVRGRNCLEECFKKSRNAIVNAGSVVGYTMDLGFVLKGCALDPSRFSCLNISRVNEIKVTGDGGRLAIDNNFIVVAIQFLDAVEKEQSVENHIPIAIVLADEEYGVVHDMLLDLDRSIDMILKNGIRLTNLPGHAMYFDFMYCFDLKFTWLVMGHAGVHAKLGQLCPCCIWAPSCSAHTDPDGGWPPRVKLSDGSIGVDPTVLKKWLEKNPCKCATPHLLDPGQGIGKSALFMHLNPQSNLVFDVLHMKNRLTEKFIKLWIWSILNPSNTKAEKLKEKKISSQTAKLEALHTFLKSVGLKKFKVDVEKNGVRFSRQFRGANFGLVVDKFLQFQEFFFLSSQEVEVWQAFAECISFTRAWKAGDGTSELTEDGKKKFRETTELLWKRYRNLYTEKHVTVYLHLLIFHAPDLMDRYGNLQKFSQQGMEALIGKTRTFYFTRANGVIVVHTKEKPGQQKKEKFFVDLQLKDEEDDDADMDYEPGSESDSDSDSESESETDELVHEHEASDEAPAEFTTETDIDADEWYTDDGVVNALGPDVEASAEKPQPLGTFKNSTIQVLDLFMRKVFSPERTKRKTAFRSRESRGDKKGDKLFPETRRLYVK